MLVSGQKVQVGNLVLARKPGEKFWIGDKWSVEVLEIENSHVDVALVGPNGSISFTQFEGDEVYLSIPDSVAIQFVEVLSGQVRVSIKAPKNVPILRAEIKKLEN